MPDLPVILPLPRKRHPTCWVCACPVVWNRSLKKYRHKNERWPFGIPAAEDFSEHEPVVADE